MLRREQIDDCARQLVKKVDIPEQLNRYAWRAPKSGGKAKAAVSRTTALGFATAWLKREGLAFQAESAKTPQELDKFAESVEKWGFGSVWWAQIQHAVIGQPIASLHGAWRSAAPTGSVTNAAERALVCMLDIPNVGISRASKWVCFSDHSRYAIYDSRISYALQLIELDGCRVFPIVPGRNRPLNESINLSSAHMAAIYIAYLKVLTQAARLLPTKKLPEVLETYERWSPALVEAALFMAGQQYLGKPTTVGCTKLWRQTASPARDDQTL